MSDLAQPDPPAWRFDPRAIWRAAPLHHRYARHLVGAAPAIAAQTGSRPGGLLGSSRFAGVVQR